MTCLTLGGCRETKDTAMEVQVVVGLQRTPCFGQCPVYELSVLNTGEATLNVGRFATKPLVVLWRKDCTVRRWTSACGAWWRIWPRDMGFDTLQSRYDDPMVMDLPANIITIDGHTVYNRFGDLT